jgi:hypothetical protein
VSVAATTPLAKERLFAYPYRPNSYAAGGLDQIATPYDTAQLKTQLAEQMGVSPSTAASVDPTDSPTAVTSSSSSSSPSSSSGGIFGSGVGPNVGPDLNPVDAVDQAAQSALSWLESNLIKGALYGALVIAGIVLAAYGIERTFGGRLGGTPVPPIPVE